MKYTNLGGTGVTVSRICLGMMTYGSKQWRDWVLEYGEAKPFVARASKPASISSTPRTFTPTAPRKKCWGERCARSAWIATT